jgi:uncharacterized membrane protein
MKEWLVLVSEYAIVLIDAMALIVVLYGTVQAFAGAARLTFAPGSGEQRREVLLRFSRWLVAGLTFQLAADIIETSITTSWDAIGRIAAVAVVRTFLNYFLERDLAEWRERAEKMRGAAPQGAAQVAATQVAATRE